MNHHSIQDTSGCIAARLSRQVWGLNTDPAEAGQMVAFVVDYVVEFRCPGIRIRFNSALADLECSHGLAYKLGNDRSLDIFQELFATVMLPEEAKKA